MEREVVDVKITSVQRCLERIKDQGPIDAQRLATDFNLQDAVVLNLIRAVQTSVDLAMHIIAKRGKKTPSDMADSFRVLADQGVITPETAGAMAKAVGFRNMAVHEYQELDMAIVAAIATKHLDDFRAFAAEVLAWLDEHDT